VRVLSAIALAGVLAALAATAAADPQWPPSATPAPGGVRAQLSTPGSGEERWSLDVYRRRGAGRIDYCLAVSLARDEGERRWQGITCALSAAIALRVDRHGLRLDCGAGGHVVGEPAEPAPTCGLVAADVQGVTVSAENGAVAAAELSEPFRVRFNRDRQILERAGIDPRRVRALPRDFRVRAFLAFVPTPPTPPGERTPRLTVSATRPDGSVLTRSIGGGVIPTPPETPSFRPAPGAPTARLAVTGVDGRRWKSTAWRNADGGLCANTRLAGAGPRLVSLGCHGKRLLMRNLRGGPQAYTGHPGRARRRTYPVYGFVRAQALALTVIDRAGRRWRAKLSPAFTTIRRPGRAIRVKAFLAAVPGPPQSPRRGLELETKLSNGVTESIGGGLFP
jgi:hypothetical protein